MTVESRSYYKQSANATQITIGRLTLWFSYRTLVAFSIDGRQFVRQNDWGPTTGRHLNAIDGGQSSRRLSSEEFEMEWRVSVSSRLAL